MKTSLLVPFTLLAATAAAFAQGPLTPPPGAPAPVMKSLDQVEARTPLVAGQPGIAIDANGTITISQPGSYYLTGNLTRTTSHAGILVTSSDVILDLNGFALIGTEAGISATAISVGSSSNVTICNGTIRGGTTQTAGVFTLAGWGTGIDSSQPTAADLRVMDVIVRGTRVRGINIGTNQGSRVERCLVDTCGDIGIVAHTVVDSIARNTNDDAIVTYFSGADNFGLVSNCLGASVGLTSGGSGISAYSARVINSVGTSADSIGIRAYQAVNCSGKGADAPGIYCEIAQACQGTSIDGNGVDATFAENCRGISASAYGIDSLNATNCYGTTTTGSSAVNCTGTATNCFGSQTDNSGNQIVASIAVSCRGTSAAIVAPQKHLGTP